LTPEESGTGALIERAARGDEQARHQLLDRHRARLRQMVALRLDHRVAARVDPSDIVQEALFDAARNLDNYLRQRPLPFYPWLRQFAWERLVDEHRKHLHARRRSVALEAIPPESLLDQSAAHLSDRLLAGGTSPSRFLIRDELRLRVRSALAEMAPHDREVLVLRYLEQLSMAEIAAILGISEGGVKSRHMRALLRLRALLDGDRPEVRE
jgi:RNA polymerase sigma-70 factor, ECF subfamily